MTSCLCAYLAPEERARGRVCTPCTNGRQGNLFGSVPRPELLESKPDTFEANAPIPLHPMNGVKEPHPDILRLIEGKAGPFFWLQDGKPTGRYFQIVEMKSGAFLYRDCDEKGNCGTDRNEWSPAPAAWTRTLVEDGLRFGTMQERER